MDRARSGGKTPWRKPRLHRERAEWALRRDAISERWCLNRMKQIRRTTDITKRKISEEESTEAPQLKELEKRLRRREEIAGRWLRKKGLMDEESPRDRSGEDELSGEALGIGESRSDKKRQHCSVGWIRDGPRGGSFPEGFRSVGRGH